MIRVVLVDDHAMIRRGLRETLSEAGDIEIVGEAGDYASLRSLLRETPVDVLVRTSGEGRVSNFLLWQAAGAPVYFTEKTWPEFDGEELDRAIALAS